MPKPRSTYFDFLRGIAIIMVVAIHAYPSSDISSTTGQLNLFLRQVLSTAVPIFLAISGFFLGQKHLESKHERLLFWKKQIPAVYIPCLIWSLIPLSGNILTQFNINGGGNCLIHILLFFSCGYSIYYFVALIIQYYLLLPFIKPVHNKGIIIATISSIISISLVTYITAIQGISLPLIVYAAPFPLWAIFFIGGVFLSQTKRTYSLKIPILLSIGGLILSYVESFYLLSNFNKGAGIKLSAFIYSAGVILLLFSHRFEKCYKVAGIFQKGCEYIGRTSFGIYLTHCYLLTFSAKIIFHTPISHSTLKWIGTVSLTLLLNICLIALVRKMAPQFSTRYLGFRG